jgi:D-alanyl-D-alanine carboxypeptidase
MERVEEFALTRVSPPVATTTPNINAFETISISADAAIVYDITTKQTLFSRRADAELPLASLTKLLTIYAASQYLQKDTLVPVTVSALSQEGESGLVDGETFTFKDLARLALVASSNDAVEAIAEQAQQIQSARAEGNRMLMASAASSLGLSRTHAVNFTGLDEDLTQSGGYGSARDMALLSEALLTQVPEVARATTRQSVSVYSQEGVLHTLKNTNSEIGRIPGALLSKTGYTDLAGGNLVVVFDAGIGHPVAVVVLGSTVQGRFSDVHTLIDATHRQFAGITNL